MDTSAYLARLGLTESDVAPTYAFLCRLQYAHVTRVPYENLDILRGIPLSLSPDALFDKIVTRGRGGYCFEVNGALAALLTALGFSVRSYLARFWRGESVTPLRRHRVLVVSIPEGEYLMDVGIGQSAPRHPLSMELDTPQEQFGETYRLVRHTDGGIMVEDLHEGAWRGFYSFTEDAQLDIDFIMPSFWCERHPDSPFHKSFMLAIKTETGRRAINGRDYKEFEGDTLTYLEENVDDARLRVLLAERFGIAEGRPAFLQNTTDHV